MATGSSRTTITATITVEAREGRSIVNGRLGFDFGCLLAALRATGTHPRDALVLLAYAAANVIELVPVTPGGLGVVEASLAGAAGPGRRPRW